MASDIANLEDRRKNQPLRTGAISPFIDALAEMIARDILEAEKETGKQHESRNLCQKVDG